MAAGQLGQDCLTRFVVTCVEEDHLAVANRDDSCAYDPIFNDADSIEIETVSGRVSPDDDGTDGDQDNDNRKQEHADGNGRNLDWALHEGSPPCV